MSSRKKAPAVKVRAEKPLKFSPTLPIQGVFKSNYDVAQGVHWTDDADLNALLESGGFENNPRRRSSDKFVDFDLASDGIDFDWVDDFDPLISGGPIDNSMASLSLGDLGGFKGACSA